MIIKTRLASDSSFYRLLAPVEDCPFSTLINDIVEQWNLPKIEEYSLLWTEAKSEQLIIDKEKEWRLFCLLHPTERNEVVELQIISTSSLSKLLPLVTSHKVKQEVKPDKAPLLQELKPPAAPKYAFHSVEPQPLKKRQQKQEALEQQRKMQEPAISNSVVEEANNGEERPQEETMSAYERVMARSRMQGEGLNQFFGTVMARRAGHSNADEDQPASTSSTAPAPEAELPAPTIVEADAIAKDADEEPAPQRRPPRTKEEIAGTNAFLENAWQERLASMGHGSNGGSVYAKLRVGKGKQRQDGDTPEASTSQSKTNGNRHSEEAREVLGPLLQGPLLIATPGSLPNSRPGSSSGLSISGASAKTSISRFLRKGQYRKQRLFSSQPSSLLDDSGTVTPSGSDIGAGASRRKRSFSFRSLSEALSREKRAEKRSNGLKQQAIISATSSAMNDVVDTILPAPSDTIIEKPGDDDTESQPASLHKEREREQIRPTLLRASQSAPLSSTAVNLSPVGGITLHISSLGQQGFMQPEFEAGDYPAPQVQKKKNLFDLMLPREIRLKCFESLVRLYDEEGDISLDPCTAKEKAVCELISLSRVSRTWQSLLLDGQLWSSVDSTLLNDISNGALLRLAQSAGPFIKKLDLHQAPHISSSLLLAMASSPSEKDNEISQFKSMMSFSTILNTKTIRLSSLTHLNLKGCRQISTKSLHRVLVQLPSLLNINISNLDTVTNDTCVLLGAFCPNLLSLDISRCFNTSGKGLVQFIQAAQGALYDKALFSRTMQSFERQEEVTLPLEELRAAACSDVNNELMAHVGNILRSLQVLDLSYCAELTDDMIKSLVEHPGPVENKTTTTKTTYQLIASHESSTFGPYITLTPRQAGGDIQSDEAHHRHLLVSLRHICLSSCRRLTDRTGIYLAYAVPNLQYLELANIGAGLRIEGLLALFKTTPLIQRVDLEGASELTETVLEAITPDIAYVQSIGLERSWNNKRRSVKRNSYEASQEEASSPAAIAKPSSRTSRKRPPPPGAWLTHLILSSVQKPDADCLLDLVRRCPRLTMLQLDDTKANDSILKEFVALCRLREVKGAYLSLVDCRALSRSINSDVLSQAYVRPRDGRRGRQFQPLDYSQVSPPPNQQQHQNGGAIINEYDDKLIVVKTFFNWEIRSQQRRIQQRRMQRAASMSASNGGSVTNRFLTRARRDSLGAALSFIGGANSSNFDEQGEGRWNRITNGLLGQGDEGDDARGCSIM